MIAVRNSALTGKKDLHVGGVGASARTALTTLADHRSDESRVLFQHIHKAAENANRILREKPWAALGLVAALGVTAGFLLSRRDW